MSMTSFFFFFFEWVAKNVKPLVQVSSRVCGSRTVQVSYSVVESY